jgi:WD40 repeat protein
MTIGVDHPSTECDLYNPGTGTWTVTGPLLATREVPTVTLLPNGKVLAAGGYDVNNGAVANSELYDPSTGQWVSAIPLNTARASHTATLLANGKVLVTGGFLGSDKLTSSEIYDPSSGAWTPSGALHVGRAGHTATLLPDGRVLVAGGYGVGALNYLPSTELFDPITETWTVTGSLAVTRYNHTATLLPNGSVVLVGGYNGTNLSSAESYDPSTGTWSLLNPMQTARYHHTAVLLPNGKLLVAAGVSPAGVDGHAELYDPATGLWQATAPLANARYGHAASLLANGKVLVSGGYNSHDLDSVELYDPGLGYSPAWQPQIATASSPLYSGDSLALGGSRFRGVSGGSSGNGQDSPADAPLVQLRALESGISMFLTPASWSGNSFVSTPIAAFPHGYALATVFVNGIPSFSSFVALLSTRSVSIELSPSGTFCWPTMRPPMSWNAPPI